MVDKKSCFLYKKTSMCHFLCHNVRLTCIFRFYVTIH